VIGSKYICIALVLILAIFLVGCGTTAQAASPKAKGGSSSVAVTTKSLPTATVMTTYSAQVQATGGVPPYQWSLASNTKLPNGVSFDTAKGLFNGIPKQQGNFQVGVTVTDSTAQTGSNKNLAILVTQSLAVGGGALGAATVGSAYSTNLSAIGGTSPYNWALTAGTLPAGLSLSSNGTLSGTPTKPTNASFTVTATDAASQTASGTYNLSVTDSTIQISTTSLPSGQTGTFYQSGGSAVGGALPYTWSVSAGSLPPGVDLNPPTGTISGTPSTGGTYAVTLTVTDAMGRSASSQFSIVIATALMALQISSGSLPDGYTGVDYSTVLAASGGTAPYTWSIASGSLPGALALAATSGSITGIPSAAGLFSLTLQVADAAQHTATKTMSLNVTSNSIDIFGGVASVSCANNGTSDWNMQKLTIGGKQRWVFCTPQGHPFVKRGVYYINTDGDHTSTEVAMKNTDYLTAKYGAADSATFSNNAYARLKSWGFNSGAPGAWRNATSSDVQPQNKVPFTEYTGWQTNLKCVNSNNCKNVWNLLWPPTHPYDSNDHFLVDVYDGAYATVVNAAFSSDTNLQSWKDNPYFMGGVGGDTDWYTTFAAGPDFVSQPSGKSWGHTVWYIAQSAPRQVVNPRNAWAVYTDINNYTKQNFVAFMQSRYSTISALNTAWGSNYSTFGSTGAQVTGASLSGAGSGPYTGTLSKNSAVDRFSVAIKAGGVVVGGDDGFGNLHGPKIASGTINYSTGAITVTFNTSVSAVTSDYYRDGWGVGSGLLDEAGNGHSWFPTDEIVLTGSTSAFKTDFEDYLAQYTAKLLGTMADAFHAVAPNKLFFGITNIGGWRVPGRCGQLRGAGQVLDVVQVGGFDGSQAQADFIGKCTGDKPFTMWYSLISNPDSQWYDVAYTETANWMTNSQATRASMYQNDFNKFWNTCNSSSGVCSWVGTDWWAYYDFSYYEKKSFGLVTWRDNAYDGVEATTTKGNCSGPTSNFTCGGELKSYGNFLGPVTNANRQIDTNLAAH
jgi:hypothetical protein